GIGRWAPSDDRRHEPPPSQRLRLFRYRRSTLTGTHVPCNFKVAKEIASMGVALDGKTNLSVYAPSELHNEVRQLAVAKGLSLGGVVEQALLNWVRKMKTMNPLDDEPLEKLA